jgi:hypothetical protein
MVRYWRRAAAEGSARAEGWHWRLAINGVGAFATGVVLVIVVLTKFTHGAWIVILAIPVMITAFYSVHRHYAHVSQQVRNGSVPLDDTARNTVVVFVDELNAATSQAVGYVRAFRFNDFRAVHLSRGPGSEDLASRWRSFCRADVELEIVPGRGHPTAAMIEYLRSIPRGPGDFVTLVIPELLTKRSLASAIRRRRAAFLLKLRLLGVTGVVVADVPMLVRQDVPAATAPVIPQRVDVLVFVSGVHDGTIRAINYARSLRGTQTRAIFVALDASEVEEIAVAWEALHVPVQLDIVEAPFRELGEPILEEVRRVTSRPDAVASVVIPEVIVAKWWQQPLHGQRALFIKRLLFFEERVILSSVPYQIH